MILKKIQALLCKIGLHKYITKEEYYCNDWGMNFKYDVTKCKHCSKRK